jgi:hypothetical protein
MGATLKPCGKKSSAAAPKCLEAARFPQRTLPAEFGVFSACFLKVG